MLPVDDDDADAEEDVREGERERPLSGDRFTEEEEEEEEEAVFFFLP